MGCELTDLSLIIRGCTCESSGGGGGGGGVSGGGMGGRGGAGGALWTGRHTCEVDAQYFLNPEIQEDDFNDGDMAYGNKMTDSL